MGFRLRSRNASWHRPARDWFAAGAVVVAILVWTVEPAAAEPDAESVLDTAKDVIFVVPQIPAVASAPAAPAAPANRWGLVLSAADSAAVLAHVAELNASVRPVAKRDPASWTGHTVGHGEYLANIGSQYQLPAETIKAFNGLASDRIRPGQSIAIPRPGELVLRVCRSEYVLRAEVDGELIRAFAIGVGDESAGKGTPLGDFVISTRQIDPVYKGLPASDPQNILGPRWLGFAPKEGVSGYGIHGTRLEETVPGAFSSGCVRMRNEDVCALFDWVARGTRTVIVP